MCAFVPIKMLRHFAHLPEDVFDGCQHVQILGSSIHSTFEGWRSYQAGDLAFKVVIIFVTPEVIMAGYLPADKNAMDSSCLKLA